MKRQGDKTRTEREFAVGELVYLKLQPYVQSSVARRSDNKLSFKFFGPFRVEACVGSVAYKLKLPTSVSIHPVFHVSQLKKTVGSQVVAAALPADFPEFQVPERILQRCWTAGPHPVEEVLVKWSLLTSFLARVKVIRKGQSTKERLPCGLIAKENRFVFEWWQHMDLT
jgi:hypothetical protein